MLENHTGPHSAGIFKLFGDLGFTVCVGSHDGFQSEKRHDPIIFLKDFPHTHGKCTVRGQW